MSARNVQLLRRFGQAYNSRDIEAMLTLCDPSIEWHSSMTVPGGAVYHGRDGVRAWLRDMEDAWGEENPRTELEALFDLGEQTLHCYEARGRGRHSGAEVAMPFADVCRWRDGLIVYYKSYADKNDALRDLGVTEDELEPIEP